MQRSTRPLLWLAILAIPVAGVAFWLYTGYSAAWTSESKDITAVVFFEHEGAWYAAASGHSESTSEDSKTRQTRTSRYPHLSTYRLTDGERVARRQYAPVYFRFSYVDDVVRALGAADGRLWAVSTDPEESLHALRPLDLEDAIPWTGLVEKAPALASGLFTKDGELPVWRGSSEDPFLLRLDSGAVVSLDLHTLAVKPAEGGLEVREGLNRSGGPRGDQRVEKAVEGRGDALEAQVAWTIGASHEAGAPGVSYVVHQSGLDREKAHILVSRWDVGKDGPTKRWTTPVPEVKPDCCNRQALRAGGQAVLWYEHWLIALDDETGKLAWTRRL
ncbi:MAG: hypothetical protein AMXMBFR64_57070 [Myxococcales bacterium]